MKQSSVILFSDIAALAAEQSHCVRKKVGCCVVDASEKNVISIGWNGTPAGRSNVCETADGLTKPEVLHAEQNALMKIAKSTLSSEGGHLFVTLSPCPTCAVLIIQGGIDTVYYQESYRCTEGIDLLRSAGVTVIKLD